MNREAAGGMSRREALGLMDTGVAATAVPAVSAAEGQPMTALARAFAAQHQPKPLRLELDGFRGIPPHGRLQLCQWTWHSGLRAMKPPSNKQERGAMLLMRGISGGGMLQLIGAGYGRTGTDSTKEALNILGLRCYHMREVIGNPANRHHLDFWCRVADGAPGARHDWEQVFQGYQAAVDNPAACVWRELMLAYPDAKVLLTVHPGGAEAWYDSVMETIYFTERLWQWRVLEALVPFARKFGPMSRKLVWQRFHRGTMNNRAAAVAEYHRHVAQVQAEVPAARLLVFNVAEGWVPLCAFLDRPVPDQPYPRVNDKEAMKKEIGRMVRGAYVILALAGAGVLGGLAFVLRLL